MHGAHSYEQSHTTSKQTPPVESDSHRDDQYTQDTRAVASHLSILMILPALIHCLGLASSYDTLSIFGLCNTYARNSSKSASDALIRFLCVSISQVYHLYRFIVVLHKTDLYSSHTFEQTNRCHMQPLLPRPSLSTTHGHWSYVVRTVLTSVQSFLLICDASSTLVTPPIASLGRSY